MYFGSIFNMVVFGILFFQCGGVREMIEIKYKFDSSWMFILFFLCNV